MNGLEPPSDCYPEGVTVVVAGEEFAAYAGEDVCRWKGLVGHFAYYDGSGFGTVIYVSDELHVCISFDESSENIGSQPEEKIEVRHTAFANGIVTRVRVTPAFADLISRSPRPAVIQPQPETRRAPIPTPKPSRTAQAGEFCPTAATSQPQPRTKPVPIVAPKPSRATQVQELCTKQGIKTLLHFTRLANLASILAKGLHTRAELETWPPDELPVFNDDERHDYQTHSISLSISFPNYKLFHAYRKKYDVPWVVIVLRPDVLWDLDCAFCRLNAATREIAEASIQSRRSFEMLQSLFWDYDGHTRAQLSIPSSYPTHPQAEVLVLGHIDRQYIREVQFEDLRTFQQESALQSQSRPIPFVCSPRLFRPRSDHQCWK